MAAIGRHHEPLATTRQGPNELLLVLQVATVNRVRTIASRVWSVEDHVETRWSSWEHADRGNFTDGGAICPSAARLRFQSSFRRLNLRRSCLNNFTSKRPEIGVAAGKMENRR